MSDDIWKFLDVKRPGFPDSEWVISMMTHEIERLNGLVGYQEGLHEKLEREYVKAIKERRAAEAEIERLRGLIDEAASCIEGLADQQEMPDPFWVPVLKALTDQKEK